MTAHAVNLDNVRAHLAAAAIRQRPHVVSLARDLVKRRHGSAHLAAPGIARALRRDGARDGSGKPFTVAHVRAAFRCGYINPETMQ